MHDIVFRKKIILINNNYVMYREPIFQNVMSENENCAPFRIWLWWKVVLKMFGHALSIIEWLMNINFVRR